MIEICANCERTECPANTRKHRQEIGSCKEVLQGGVEGTVTSFTEFVRNDFRPGIDVAVTDAEQKMRYRQETGNSNY